MSRSTCILVLPLLLTSTLFAEDWAQFRGPTADGICREKGFPLTWSADENVKWKTKLAAPGNGSPIVSNGRIFVTVAEDGGKKRSLDLFDRKGGEELWRKTVSYANDDPTHKTNPYGASTPLAFGDHVVVWHGSAGLYCYDLQGKQIWMRDLGEFQHTWGYGSSPILHEGRVILNCGPGKRVFMTAIDLKSGEIVWQTEEPQLGDGVKNESGKYMGSWATPVVVDVAGKSQIVCTMSTRVNGYDPASGAILWSCDGMRGTRGDLAYSSPLVNNGVCVATGGYRGPSIGFKIDGSGDLTSRRLWRKDENPQSIGSGVFLGEHIFVANAGPGTIQCIDAESGKEVWKDRGAGGDNWGSIVSADGHLYVTNKKGDTLVFRPNPKKFEKVAVNKLGESSNATPAFSDGELFIRTDEHLYCIAK